VVFYPFKNVVFIPSRMGLSSLQKCGSPRWTTVSLLVQKSWTRNIHVANNIFAHVRIITMWSFKVDKSFYCNLTGRIFPVQMLIYTMDIVQLEMMARREIAPISHWNDLLARPTDMQNL
jgi:hypothetical protein